MSYELKRHKLIDLSVTCGGKEYPVVMDIGKSGGDFNKRYANLVNAEADLKRAQASLANGTVSEMQTLTDAEMVYGTAMVSLMELLFGINGAHEIISYFEGDYTDLLLSIVPFIRDEFVPALKAARHDKMAAYEKAVKPAGGFLGNVFRK